MYDEGMTKTSTTTLPQVSRGVAKLLELPLERHGRHRKNFAYVQSFNVSPMDMLKALEKATDTTKKDWKITEVPIEKAIAKGKEEFVKGGMGINVLYGANFKPGMGGCYEGKSSNNVLGLAEDDFEEVVRGLSGGQR